MFVDTAFNVKDSFVENSKKYLKSSMEKLNFLTEPEKQRKYINNWVLEKTNNKITNLFPEGCCQYNNILFRIMYKKLILESYWFTGSIDKSTALILANAVHFKSAWNHKFNDAEDEPFYLTPNNKVTVKMMTLRHNLQYYHDDSLNFGALELPYEVNISFKFLLR